jgi:hypothetical protein
LLVGFSQTLASRRSKSSRGNHDGQELVQTLKEKVNKLQQ